MAGCAVGHIIPAEARKSHISCSQLCGIIIRGECRVASPAETPCRAAARGDHVWWAELGNFSRVPKHPPNPNLFTDSQGEF